jgi:pantetheine-phosphate adenylyltransferase
MCRSAGKTREVASALYAGSFDPVHLGHLSVVERSATMFDSVTIAVLGNPTKRAGMFSVAERIELLAGATRHLPNVSCIGHRGLTIDAVRRAGADGIVRTGHKDHDDEWAMLAMNEMVSGCKTFFVPPDPKVAHLSSSLVRSLVSSGRLTEARALVPSTIAAELG